MDRARERAADLGLLLFEAHDARHLDDVPGRVVQPEEPLRDDAERAAAAAPERPEQLPVEALRRRAQGPNCAVGRDERDA